MLWLWILIAVVVILIFILISYFNRFALLENRINNSESQINVQLRKRADLVPNLINAVKGFMKHEKSIITEVTNARKAMLSAGNIQEKAKAGNGLQKALKSIFALAENYPNLKSNENFLQLQQELSSIEDKVAYARQHYNDSVLDYSNLFKTFPGNVFAKIYGKTQKHYLEIPAESKAVPKVSF
jgi:LemA protein